MAHKWDGKVNREVEHRVTCTLCGVLVERVAGEGGKLRNYHTPAGGERTGGLAPRCTGGAVEQPAAKQLVPADAVQPEASAGLKLSAKSLELFKLIAEDMPNWGGHMVPTDGNIQITPSQRGNLTDLKKKGLCETQEAEGTAWVTFTDAGYALTTELGYDLEQYREDTGQA